MSEVTRDPGAALLLTGLAGGLARAPEALKRAVWRPLLRASLARRRSSRERHWTSPRVLGPLLEVGGDLVGSALELEAGRPLWADYSGAILLPVRPVGSPTRHLLLKIGYAPAFRDRLVDGTAALERIRERAEIPGDVRRLIPRTYGARRLESGVVVAVEDRLPGIPLSSLVEERERFDRLEARAIDVLVDLHRATRDADHRPGLVDALDTLVERIDASGAFSPETLATLRRFAGAFRGCIQDARLPCVLTHGDFHQGNLLVSRRDDDVTGLLDFDGVRDRSFPVVDLYHLLRNRADFLPDGRPAPLGDLSLYVPPPSSPRRAPVAKYFEALQIPFDLAPCFAPLYLLDCVDRRLPESGPVGANVRSYEAPLTQLVRQVLH